MRFTTGHRLGAVLQSRIAFVTALVMSAALFAYSLAGIAGAGGDLRSPNAKNAERSAPASYRDCPADRGHAVRL